MRPVSFAPTFAALLFHPDRLGELRNAPGDIPAGVDDPLLVALRMLEDPKAAGAKPLQVARTQASDCVAVAAIDGAEPADRNAATTAAAVGGRPVVDRGAAGVVGRV